MSMVCDQQSAAVVQEQHSHQEIAEEILKLDPASQERLVPLKMHAAILSLCLRRKACPSQLVQDLSGVSCHHRVSSMHGIITVNHNAILLAQAETRGRSGSSCGITPGTAFVDLV